MSGERAARPDRASDRRDTALLRAFIEYCIQEEGSYYSFCGLHECSASDAREQAIEDFLEYRQRQVEEAR